MLLQFPSGRFWGGFQFCQNDSDVMFGGGGGVESRRSIQGANLDVSMARVKQLLVCCMLRAEALSSQHILSPHQPTWTPKVCRMIALLAKVRGFGAIILPTLGV